MKNFEENNEIKEAKIFNKENEDIEKEAEEFDYNDFQEIESFGDDVLLKVKEISDNILEISKEHENNSPVIILDKVDKIVQKTSTKDLKRITRKPNIIEKGMNLITKGEYTRNYTKNFNKRFLNLEKDFNNIDVELEDYAGSLVEMQSIIDETLQNNKEQLEELDRKILIGKKIFEKMKKELKNKKNSIETQEFKQKLDLFDKKLHGLEVTKTSIGQQAAITLLNIRKNNAEIAESLKSTHLLTIPILKNAISNSIFIRQQYKITNTIASINNATNKAMKLNVENTILIGKKVAEINTKGGIDAKELIENQKKLLKGSEEIKKIYDNASEIRNKERNLLKESSKQMVSYLSKTTNEKFLLNQENLLENKK